MAPADAHVNAWQSAWRSLPTIYQLAPLTEGITDHHSDANIFCTLWDRYLGGHSKLICDVIRTVCIKQSCNPEIEDQEPTEEDLAPIKRILNGLRQKAECSDTNLSLITKEARWRNAADHSAKPLLPLPAATVAAKCKKWMPRDAAKHDQVTQQQIDDALLQKWSERIIAALRPYPLPF